MIRRRMFTLLAAVATFIAMSGVLAMPLASADKLGNGLDVTCKAVTDTQLTCVISGCPRVNGDYVVDAVHVMQNGHQDEYPFKCINGHTATHNIFTTVDTPITLGFQACRKKDLEGDWCGGWSDYTYMPVAKPQQAPQAPPPPPPVTCPAGSPVSQVPAGQTCPSAPPPVTCPAGSPVPQVPAGQTCPKPAPVTNAITATFDNSRPTTFGVTVKNSSALPATCNYEANGPISNTTRTFAVAPKGSQTESFNGVATLGHIAQYQISITCTDSSGSQTEPLGSVNQTVGW